MFKRKKNRIVFVYCCRKTSSTLPNSLFFAACVSGVWVKINFNFRSHFEIIFVEKKRKGSSIVASLDVEIIASLLIACSKSKTVCFETSIEMANLEVSVVKRRNLRRRIVRQLGRVSNGRAWAFDQKLLLLISVKMANTHQDIYLWATGAVRHENRLLLSENAENYHN